MDVLDSGAPPPTPAATVIVLRELEGDIEVLLLKRNPELRVDGGFWVFPGGKFTEDELKLEINDAAKVAAARECQEECGIDLQTDAMVPMSRWVTPTLMPKRFDTYFFITTIAADTPVIIDNSEIVDFQWMKPAEAIEQQRTGKMAVRPPACVSIREIANFARAEDCVQSMRKRSSIPLFEPKGFKLPLSRDPETGAEVEEPEKVSGMVFLYNGDAGYEDNDPENTSMKHRMIFDAQGLRYYNNNERRI